MNKFLAALQFLTRISLKPDLVVDPVTFGRSMVYFPLVGVIIGSMLAVLAWLGNNFLTPLVTAGLILTLEVAITGGLHLDGFMDTMDGLYSGRSRERILEIMKDSRVGAHSVMALVILFILKAALLVEIAPGLLIPGLILMPMVGRLGQVLAAVRFPYIRPEGLGKLFKDYVGPSQLWPGIVLSLGASWLAFNYWGPLLITLMLAVMALQGKYITNKLGGLTGDVYGAICEISEVVFLMFIYFIGRL